MTAPLTQRCASRIRPDRIDHSWPPIHRLNESGKWQADAIERQLAHQEENEIRGAYTHAAEFWQARADDAVVGGRARPAK